MQDRRRFTEILKSPRPRRLGRRGSRRLATSVLVVAGTCWIWDLAGRPTDLDGRYMLANALGIGLMLVVVKVWIPWSVSACRRSRSSITPGRCGKSSARS